MNEHQGRPTGDESGSVDIGPAVSQSSESHGQPMAASAEDGAHVDSPDLAPAQGEVPETIASDASNADTSTADTPKVDTPKADTPRFLGKLTIMSSGDHGWDGDPAGREPEIEPSSGNAGHRRFSALAAVAALALIAGALGGGLATAGVAHFIGGDATASGNQALEASVARIDADILALKASVEHTSKLGMGQFNKTSDRLDKVEKAQAEPAAKLAELSKAVDKLRATPVATPVAAAAAPAAAKEVTGSVSAPATSPASPPKVEVGRLPTVEGWVLRDVANGGALIEGRQGMFEVYAGDPVPGIGRVDAIRRQDGHWVVVTSKGLIVAR